MKILVYSDSHNNMNSIEKLNNVLDGFDRVLFLGDGISDFETLTSGFNGEKYAVLGNCDFSGDYPSERVIEFDGIKIFMCHGHRYGVKMNLNSIFYKGKEVGADIVLFGHSHTQIIEKSSGLYIMNPGSVSHSYGIGKTGYGVIEIDNERIKDIYLKNI
ncbi:MAG: metallophosphoesterase [Clostridium sp.]